jgi:hypothetical protein
MTIKSGQTVTVIQGYHIPMIDHLILADESEEKEMALLDIRMAQLAQLAQWLNWTLGWLNWLMAQLDIVSVATFQPRG